MENKKNGLVIILIIIIAVLCLIIGWLLGSKFDLKENQILEDPNPSIGEEQNVDIETAFNNFITTKGLSINENAYDKESLNSINCMSAKSASENGYLLEIYKFNSDESAKKYFSDQKNYKLTVSNVKQLISSNSINNYDYYEAILTPNLDNSPAAQGDEVEYIYQLRVDNFYIVLFETSTNSDKTNIINIAKELKTTLNIK